VTAVHQAAEQQRQGRMAELQAELDRLRGHGVARMPTAADVDQVQATLNRHADLAAWWRSPEVCRMRRLSAEAERVRERDRLPLPVRRAAARGEVWPEVTRSRPVADYTRSQMGTPVMRSQVTGMPPPTPAETVDPRVLARRVQQTGDF
jgi:hypothetical protein